MTILAAHPWDSNAQLIEACAQLGYLHKEWTTLDPTYGEGAWWKLWRPDVLIDHNFNEDGVDFRDLPYDAGTFDAAVFDPPYVAVGGRATSGMQEMYRRYGLLDAPTNPIDLQFLINDGLIEVGRVTKHKGFVLVKCADYISSGKYFPGTHYTLACAFDHGFKLIDRFEYVVEKPRPQPPKRRQVHARRNLSTLFVFRAPKYVKPKPKIDPSLTDLRLPT